ncbi:cytochrome P450 [Nocardioides sp.]|uniref:cytochrome P450 n=1 Tax=Nocardioides sp. TaxID=35761 RepID=UPI002734A845|nr:cytochrome P450 [Nocardioides sp.]MDP3889637.1 cytochrome P450 [Nocardioides sp.]
MRSGYRALPEQRSRHRGADAFETSLLGRRAVVVRGHNGARLFYDPTVVEREGAVPAPLARLIFGRGAVHGLDGDEHAERKAIFLEILTEQRVDDLADAIGHDLDRRVQRWTGRDVVVFDELVEVYGAAVQAWAGIDAPPPTIRRNSRRLATIVDGFGGAGAAYPRAWLARLWANRWARDLIEAIRGGQLDARPDSVLALMATGPGRGLSARVAGVELLNILRPTVAVAWPGTFLARHLTAFPQWRPLLQDGERATERRAAFGHEVRRTCPFVPALAGRARGTAEIDGVRVEPGDMLVLDVPATNHDPGEWSDPGEFLPERFAGLMPDPYGFVPQGGGDPATGHRCPGEPLTVRILAETARVLSGLDYEPAAAPGYDDTRIPTLPARGFPVRIADRGADRS